MGGRDMTLEDFTGTYTISTQLYPFLKYVYNYRNNFCPESIKLDMMANISG